MPGPTDPLPLPVQIDHFKVVTQYCAMSNRALATEFTVIFEAREPQSALETA